MGLGMACGLLGAQTAIWGGVFFGPRGVEFDFSDTTGTVSRQCVEKFEPGRCWNAIFSTHPPRMTRCVSK